MPQGHDRPQRPNHRNRQGQSPSSHGPQPGYRFGIVPPSTPYQAAANGRGQQTAQSQTSHCWSSYAQAYVEEIVPGYARAYCEAIGSAEHYSEKPGPAKPCTTG